MDQLKALYDLYDIRSNPFREQHFMYRLIYLYYLDYILCKVQLIPFKLSYHNFR